jgi:hypothetical protein
MKQTNFELAVEVIGQAVSELLSVKDSTNNDTRQAINSLINCAEEGYVLIQWPESQEYMEEEWFEEEAILALGSEDKTGSSAYFIPIKRIV